MWPSPELGEGSSQSALPPLTVYKPGNKSPVPRDAEVIRSHPPRYLGDWDNRKLPGAYWWEGLDRNNKKDEKLRLGMQCGEERKPRCDCCEEEDRACMSLLSKKYKNTGCARCWYRHFHCTHAKNSRANVDASVSTAGSVTSKLPSLTETVLAVCHFA